MSDEDPWKSWYADKKSPAAGAPDAPEEPTVATPAGATFTPRASSPAGGWPEQPPASSTAPGYPATRNMSGAALGGDTAYGGTAYGGTAYGDPAYGDAAYGGAGYVGAPPGQTPVRGGRRWRFWGQPGRRGRRIALILGIVVVLLVGFAGGTYLWINGKLNRSVTLPAFSGTSAGTNWLIVGSDSRSGLTTQEIVQDHVGFDFGTDDSDSLMLLHMGSGRPVLISIPRDSYVPIPGHGNNKINAALAFGGPSLLIKTVEEVTGLRINHYMGIGFGGLVSVVNTVGGVRICLPSALNDSYSGLHLSKGCHNLNGTQALAFVRDRHSFATSDLQRIQDQRAFLKALLSKATTPGVYLNPFTSFPFASTAASSIAVDKGTSLYDLLQAAFALRNPETGTVPISNPDLVTANAGDAVEWNRTEALELFNALQKDKKVPAGLLSGTTIGSQS